MKLLSYYREGHIISVWLDTLVQTCQFVLIIDGACYWKEDIMIHTFHHTLERCQEVGIATGIMMSVTMSGPVCGPRCN